MDARTVSVICVLSAAWVLPAHAQTTAVGGSATTSNGKAAAAPYMSSKATTLAPVAPGSTQVHQVQTPKVSDRTTMTGGNTNGGAN